MFCLNVCLCVLHACLVPMKVREGCQISWNYSYSWLSVTMWVLGTDSQGSAISLCNFHGVIEVRKMKRPWEIPDTASEG